MMNTLRRGAVMMAAGFLAGCAMAVAGTGAPAKRVENQVVVSGQYARIEAALPEAKGALAFLADEAGLKAGTIKLTKAQAEAAMAKLVELTKQELRSTPGVTVSEGNPVTMGFGDLGVFAGSEKSPKTINGYEVKGRPDVDLSLSVFPQVSEDKVMQIEVGFRVITLEGVEETVKAGAASAGVGEKSEKAPARFYQPILSMKSLTTNVRIAEGETVVMRTDRKTKLVVNADGTKTETEWVGEETGESLLVFLRAKLVPVNDAGAARGRERMRLEAEAWKARQAK